MSRVELTDAEHALIVEHRAEAAAFRTIRSTVRKARRVYGCWRCGMKSLHAPAPGCAPILPGDRYRRTWGYIDGQLEDYAEHVECPDSAPAPIERENT